VCGVHALRAVWTTFPSGKTFPSTVLFEALLCHFLAGAAHVNNTGMVYHL